MTASPVSVEWALGSAKRPRHRANIALALVSGVATHPMGDGFLPKISRRVLRNSLFGGFGPGDWVRPSLAATRARLALVKYCREAPNTRHMAVWRLVV